MNRKFQFTVVIGKVGGGYISLCQELNIVSQGETAATCDEYVRNSSRDKFFIILFILFQQSLFAQVQVQNNYKTARTSFAVQKLQAVINQLKLARLNYTIRIDTAANGKKESFSICSNGAIVSGLKSAGSNTKIPSSQPIINLPS